MGLLSTFIALRTDESCSWPPEHETRTSIEDVSLVFYIS
jgi:hypothetical protein